MRSSHRLRHWIFALGTAAVVLVGICAWIFTGRGAHEVSLGAAKRRAGTSTTAPTSPAAPTVSRPEAGVYQYQGSGKETLSKPAKHQGQGPGMPGTVTYTSATCFSVRIDYSSNHWQRWDYCWHDGDLTERGGVTFSRWDFGAFAITNTSTFSCTNSVVIRKGMRPGDTWNARCSGTSNAVKGTTVTAGPITYLGPGYVRVARQQVAGYHFRQIRTLSGSQTGNQDTDLWFRADGLPLSNTRTNVVTSNSPIGRVTYTEQGTFQLAAPGTV